MKIIQKTLFAALCCTMALTAQAQERTFHRNKVLIEKHTGTGCQACPAADKVIENYIAGTDNEDNVALLRHHSFSNGSLNRPSGVELFGIWGAGVWPSMNVDRYGFFGYDKKDRTSYSTKDAYTLRSLNTIETRLATPTYVSLSLEGSSFDPTTRRLHLVISGEVTKKLPFLRVHAFVTQSGIVAPQTGATNDYVHDDAVRDHLMNNFQGDSFTVNPDGTYCVTLEKTLESKYNAVTIKPENMKVVAFVSSYIDESVSFYDRDFSTSEVHNADVVALLDLPKQAPCAAPTIEYANGAFVCKSTTSGATCHYDVAPITLPSDGQGTINLEAPAFVVTAYADATGFARSAKVRRTFSLRDILGEDSSNVSDVNNDGRVNKADVDALVNKILQK